MVTAPTTMGHSATGSAGALRTKVACTAAARTRPGFRSERAVGTRLGPARPAAPAGSRWTPGSTRVLRTLGQAMDPLALLSTMAPCTVQLVPYQGVHQDAAARQLAPYQGVHPQDAAARQPAPYQGVHPHESAVRIQAGAGGWTRLERIHAPVLDPARPAAAAGGGSRNRRVKRWRRAWRVAAGADPWPHAGSSSARGRCRRACWRSGPSGV